MTCAWPAPSSLLPRQAPDCAGGAGFRGTVARATLQVTDAVSFQAPPCLCRIMGGNQDPQILQTLQAENVDLKMKLAWAEHERDAQTKVAAAGWKQAGEKAKELAACQAKVRQLMSKRSKAPKRLSGDGSNAPLLATMQQQHQLQQEQQQPSPSQQQQQLQHQAEALPAGSPAQGGGGSGGTAAVPVPGEAGLSSLHAHPGRDVRHQPKFVCVRCMGLCSGLPPFPLMPDFVMAGALLEPSCAGGPAPAAGGAGAVAAPPGTMGEGCMSCLLCTPRV